MAEIDTRGRERRLIVWPLVGSAAVYALLFAPPQLWLIAAVLGLIGLLNGPMDVAMFTIRQRRTDPAWMGRGFAVSMALNFAGFPVGSALGGLLVGESLNVAVLLGTVSALLAAFCAWRLIPDRDPGEQAAAGPDSRVAEVPAAS